MSEKIIHPTIFPVNGIPFRVSSDRALTDDQARNAVFLFLKTHKIKKRPAKGKVVTIEIDDEFLLNFLQG